MAPIATAPHTEPVAVPQVPLQPCDVVRQEASKYDWDVNVMVAIAQAESHCRAEATGDTSITYWQNGRAYGYSVSAFQVRILPGREHCDSHDITVNVKCAYDIYSSQGMDAWSVVLNGKYKEFM